MQFGSVRLLKRAAIALALSALCVLPFASGVSAAGAPYYPSTSPAYPYGPSRYTPGGVPEYGMVGQGTWQVAGIVNLGEPSLRIVYDQTVPGARDRAMGSYYQLTGTMNQFSQPGVTTGLRQVGYSAHYDGVQFQLWGDNPNVDEYFVDTFAAYGMPLIRA